MTIKPENTRRTTMPDRLGLAGLGLVLLGPLLAWLRLVPGMAGFGIYALGGLSALAAAASSLVALARGRAPGLGRLIALPIALAFVASSSAGWGKPRINDFTTDPTNPPAFVAAARDAANAGRDMSYPPAWAALQTECCADLRPVRLPLAPSQALELVRRTAEAMPAWKVVATDDSAGTLEAVATTRVFGFRDDVVIRVRPDGAGSIVDVRSKSRDGKGDLGANAERIRDFVAALGARR